MLSAYEGFCNLKQVFSQNPFYSDDFIEFTIYGAEQEIGWKGDKRKSLPARYPKNWNCCCFEGLNDLLFLFQEKYLVLGFTSGFWFLKWLFCFLAPKLCWRNLAVLIFDFFITMLYASIWILEVNYWGLGFLIHNFCGMLVDCGSLLSCGISLI